MKVVVIFNHERGGKTENVFSGTKEECDRFIHFLCALQRCDNGYFSSGHNEFEMDFVNKIHEKFDYDYEDYVPDDGYYANYRADIDEIYVKQGNLKQQIVYVKALEQRNKVELPSIGDTMTVSTGNVCGYGNYYKAFEQKTKTFEDLKTLGLAYDLSYWRGAYMNLECEVVDIYSKVDATNIHHVILCKYEDIYITTSFHGYDPNVSLEDKRHYVYTGEIQ